MHRRILPLNQRLVEREERLRKYLIYSVSLQRTLYGIQSRFADHNS